MKTIQNFPSCWMRPGSFIVVVVAGVMSCSSVPYRSARNTSVCAEGTAPTIEPFYSGAKTTICVANGVPPSPPSQVTVSRARQAFSERNPDVPDVFVGLAISGGGSRAAAFGLAVMEQLQEIGILQHVSAISTTSGGGLAGAYYAMKGTRIDWQEGKRAMSSDFLGRWFAKNLLPQNLITTTFSHEDRSDLMADVFDNTLFAGTLYGDLGEFAIGTRPIWLANATDGSLGTRFTFSEERLRRMNSSLASLPISQAVMASAAFPGVFSSVTLRNFLPVKKDQNGKLRDPVIAYTHLIDGGPTDNLGLESLLQLAASHRQVIASRQIPGRDDHRCLILIADAYPSGVPSRKMWDADPRAWYDHFVDTNFLDAFDALLARRRADILSYAGIEEGDRSGRLLSHQFVKFDIPFGFGLSSPFGQAKRVGNFTSTEIEKRLREGNVLQPIPVPEGYFRCAAWHINLSGIEAVRRYVVDDETKWPVPFVGDAEGKDPLMRHRASLNSVVSQIGTNFRLSGPRHCSTSFLLDAVYAAAFVLVREDYENQRKACSWVRDAGLSVGDTCGTFPGNKTLTELPLDMIEPASGRLATGRLKDEAVKCRK